MCITKKIKNKKNMSNTDNFESDNNLTGKDISETGENLPGKDKSENDNTLSGKDKSESDMSLTGKNSSETDENLPGKDKSEGDNILPAKENSEPDLKDRPDLPGDCNLSLIGNKGAKNGFPHPSFKKFLIPRDLGNLHEKQVQKLNFTPWNSFEDHLLNGLTVLDDSNRKGLAEDLTSKHYEIRQKLTEKNGPVKTTLAYTLSGLVSSGDLLLCLLLYPVYFFSDPILKLQELLQIFVALETELGLLINNNFSKQIDLVLKNRNASNNAGQRLHLVKCAVFGVVAMAYQLGITIPGRDFKIESLVIPGVCLSSKTVASILFPILKRYNWRPRQFGRVISPFIFYFSYRNRVEGYLTPKLSKYLVPSNDADLLAFESALLSEIHSNSPFCHQAVKNVLIDHQRRINKK
jgi:hypothetical protein